MIDYNKEVEQLQSNASWFKPEAGTYKCKILKEPEAKLKTFNQGTDREEHKKIFCIELEANDKRYMWDISVGKTLNSTHGQLMLLGRYHGTLTGVEFTLLVQSIKGQDGKAKNKYTIVEAVELANKTLK